MDSFLLYKVLILLIILLQDVLDSSRKDYNDIVKKLNRSENIQAFAENCENVHNGPHVSVCGDGRQRNKCLLSMGIQYILK